MTESVIKLITKLFKYRRNKIIIESTNPKSTLHKRDPGEGGRGRLMTPITMKYDLLL